MPEFILVEDDDDDIYFFKAACESLSSPINLTVLRDGIELIDYTEKHSVANKVFLLDLNMPQMGGLEALTHLNRLKLFHQMVIVTYTTSSRDKDIWDAYELGVKSYLLKPNSISGIQQLVTTLIHYWFNYTKYPAEGAL